MAKTISDWLAELEATVAPAAIDARVVALVNDAESVHDLRALLAGIAKDRRVADGHVSRVAERLLLAAGRERDLWSFRDVATARMERLGDRAGARAALEAGFRCFEQPPEVPADRAAMIGFLHETRGYEWQLLADGFVETVSDEEGARRCLETGLARARAQGNGDDLLSIATGWHTHLDRETALELVREVEAMTTGRPRRWTLANAWWAAGEPAQAMRVLADGIAQAACVRDAREVAMAYATHGHIDPARDALACAQRFAKDAPDWLVIAETAFDMQLEPAVVRHALEHAQALADGDMRQRVARGYGFWLGDETAAAALGPLGVAPATLGERQRELHGFEPSPSALFDWLRAQITPERLASIAHADYGMDADKHAAALRDIAVHGRLPTELGWVPGEVLHLTRWSEGEHTDHVTRAFACTVLCLVPEDTDSLSDNGIVLLESCRALGGEALFGCERLLAWCAETRREVPAEHEEFDEPEARVALLLLFLLCAGRDASDPRLEVLEARLGHVAVLRSFIQKAIRAELWAEMLALCLEPSRARPVVGRVLAALDHRA